MNFSIPFKIADAHCDFITKYHGGMSIMNPFNVGQHITLQGMKKSNIKLQFFAAWIPPNVKNTSYLQQTLALIDSYFMMLQECSPIFMHITHNNFDDFMTNHDSIGSILTVEGGHALEGKLENLQLLYHKGVRLITLTWNARNEIGEGINENSEKGLTAFGKLLIAEMNNLRMMIDVSHLNEKGFWDVVEYSNAPIIASHSNAKDICDHPRNLNKEQITSIIRRNGYIGVNFCSHFLLKEKPTVKTIISHIDYIMSLGGGNTVGFGADFDGIDNLPEGIYGCQDYDIIINELLRIGYHIDDIQKICYHNLLNYLKFFI